MWQLKTKSTNPVVLKSKQVIKKTIQTKLLKRYHALIRILFWRSNLQLSECDFLMQQLYCNAAWIIQLFNKHVGEMNKQKVNLHNRTRYMHSYSHSSSSAAAAAGFGADAGGGSSVLKDPPYKPKAIQTWITSLRQSNWSSERGFGCSVPSVCL